MELLREEEETIAAIREGLESIDRGEGVLLGDAITELRAKYWIAEEAQNDR